MKKAISVIVSALLAINFSTSTSFAESTPLPVKPEQSEQDKRDDVVYPILLSQMLEKIRSAHQLASTTGTVTTLDEIAVNELVSIIDRRAVYMDLYAKYAQRMKDSYEKCSQDLSLATAELKNCRNNFSAFSSIAAVLSTRIKELYEYKNRILSAQDSIKSAATSYFNEKKVLTISCVKGKAVKKVVGLNPKCPTGYKVKK